MGEALIESLHKAVNAWASSNGLNVSLIASELAGGLVINATLLPREAYASFYREYAQALGYPAEALGSELTLESGQCVIVEGLDPIAERPQMIVQSNGQRWHLSQNAFEQAWSAKSKE